MSALAYPFMQRAFIAGICLALVSSYLGVFVVQRRLAFLGSGLSHAAFGGVALGIFLNIEPLWVAVPFTVLVALAIQWLRDHTGLAGDTVVGILFSLSMALGIVLLSFTATYSGDAFRYLFGSILAVTHTDILWGVALLIALGAAFPLWYRWTYATFDPIRARAEGLPVKRDDYCLTLALAVTIVVAMKVVGMVLVSAFLVLPAATARIISRTFAQMTIWSLVFGVVSLSVGLWVSFYGDLPSGPTIILVQSALFFVLLPFQKSI